MLFTAVAGFLANISGTYGSTGGSGSNGQFTAMSNAAIAENGYVPNAGDHILLMGQTVPAQNGLWTVTTVGTGSNGVWDRVAGWGGVFDYTTITGTTNQLLENTTWKISNAPPFVIGTGSPTNLTFVQTPYSEAARQGNLVTLLPVIQAAEYVVDTGAANAYVVTLANVPPGYFPGLSFYMKLANGNTGASTVNVNALGAKALKKRGTTALASADCPAGAIVLCVYDGTNFQVWPTAT